MAVPKIDARPSKSSVRVEYRLLKQIWLRHRGLLCSWQPYVSLVLAGATSYIAWVSSAATVSISSIAMVGLTVAAITVGACVSAVVLSIGLPGGDRLRRWARQGDDANKSALSELVFVLVWAALWQLFVVIVCILAILLGGNGPFAPSGMRWSHWLGLIVSFWVFYYALIELFVVIDTLWQIGAVVVSEERSTPNKDTDHSRS